MQDPYGAFRRDMVSALRLSALAARSAGDTRAGLASFGAFDPSDFTPVDTSGVGEFPWQWDSFGTFNAETWTFLATRASTAPSGTLRLTGGLTTWYFNAINATVYHWTDADRAAVTHHLDRATQAQSQLIHDFQSLFGVVTPARKKTAAAALGATTMSNLIYVVEYQIAFVWSGRQAAQKPPLTASDIRNTPLDTLFANAPSKAQSTLLPTLQAALQHQAAWEGEIDRLWNVSHAIRDAADNANEPAVSNQSGMYTVDRNGATVVRHSFDVTPSVADLQAHLSSSATITLAFSVRQRADGRTVVAMPGKAEAAVPGSVLALTPHKGRAQAVLSHDGAGDQADIQITYHGPAEVTVNATPFAQAPRTGWYYEHPLLEAAANQGEGIPDGYQFQLPVGGREIVDPNVGILQKLLICRGVTMTVAYPKGDAHRLARSLPTGTGTHATVVGDMQVGAQHRQAAIARVSVDPVSGTPAFVLNVGANAAADPPGPLAHVIGARVNHLFAGVAPAVDAEPAPQVLASPMCGSAVPHDTARGAALVSCYERLFGVVTKEQMQSAGVRTPLTFVLRDVLGRSWSGRARAGQPPLTTSDMKAARSLRQLFPAMPLDGSAVLTELHAFLSAGGNG